MAKSFCHNDLHFIGLSPPAHVPVTVVWILYVTLAPLGAAELSLPTIRLSTRSFLWYKSGFTGFWSD
jgi:hypothetical protein